MEEPLASELLARYLASEASAEERATVDAWAAADPAHAADLAHMRDVWAARGPGHVWDVDRAWRKVDERIAVPGRGIGQLRGEPRGKASLVWRVAAMLVLAAGLAFAWRTYGRAPAPSQIYVTGVGERKTVDLADGTRVTMGPVSELRVSAGFNDADRRVDLTGEAWFEVKHDESRSFQVFAFGVLTEDIGTAFAVRALAADSLVRVVVSEGSVSVRLKQTPVKDGATLNATDAVQLDARTLKAHITRGVMVERVLGWRTGNVDFDNTTVGDVAVEMQRWYGITMQFQPPEIARHLLSYSMPTNNLTEALNVLSTSLGVHTERKGDTVIVR